MMKLTIHRSVAVLSLLIALSGHTTTAWTTWMSLHQTALVSSSSSFSYHHHQSTSLFSSFSAAESTKATATTETDVLDTSEYDLSLFSPCKINLFLRIIRKRPDGFHDLASLFQTIGFGDMLHLKLLSSNDDNDDNDDDTMESDIFECNMEGVPTDKTNLVIRALDLVRKKTGNEDKFFKANLIKQVPAQAGLGGGSGNAAAAMWGANELLGNPATLEEVRFYCIMRYSCVAML